MQAANPVLRFSEHQAAVKAIAWSPHQHGLLVSGGGTADRCIRFWNTTTGQSLQCIDTGSQVGRGGAVGEGWHTCWRYECTSSRQAGLLCDLWSLPLRFWKRAVCFHFILGPPQLTHSSPCCHLPPRLFPQVCNLSWSKNVNELVSTHGYSQNQIIVWRYPTMQARLGAWGSLAAGR